MIVSVDDSLVDFFRAEHERSQDLLDEALGEAAAAGRLGIRRAIEQAEPFAPIDRRLMIESFTVRHLKRGSWVLGPRGARNLRVAQEQEGGTGPVQVSAATLLPWARRKLANPDSTTSFRRSAASATRSLRAETGREARHFAAMVSKRLAARGQVPKRFVAEAARGFGDDLGQALAARWE